MSDDFLCEHTFALPSKHDVPTDFDSSITKELYAERYGGFGVGYCGGSGRCGGDEHVQLKGVGITPLWRPNPELPNELWHSSGIVDAVEAAREIVWTEICSEILPYGAIPMLGAVTIGQEADQLSPASRVILFRENCLRPAHFMRNVLHERRIETGIHVDVTRVANALKQLPEIFGSYFLDRSTRKSSSKQLGEGLLEMARRLSIQLATAFSRRIFHGAPLCSNLSLDGRLLDFGATTFVSAYQREAAQPCGIDQWNQKQILIRSISKLHENIFDFAGWQLTKHLPTIEHLRVEIDVAWQKTLEKEIFRMAGLNSSQANEKLVRKHHQFVDCCMELMKDSARTPYVLRNALDEEVTNARSLGNPRYDLNAVISRLSREDDAYRKVRSLQANFGISEESAEKLVLSHVALILDIERGRSVITEPAARLYERAIRRNQELTFLHRHILDAHFASITVDWQEYSSEIQRTITAAVQVLKTDD